MTIKTIQGVLNIKNNRVFLTSTDPEVYGDFAVHFMDDERLKIREALKKVKKDHTLVAGGLCNIYAEAMTVAVGFAGYIFPGTSGGMEELPSSSVPPISSKKNEELLNTEESADESLTSDSDEPGEDS